MAILLSIERACARHPHHGYFTRAEAEAAMLDFASLT
jgi:hypothetical protein